MSRKRKVIPYRPQKQLPTVFPCPNCGKVTMRVTISKIKGTASILCGFCGLTEGGFLVNELTEPADIYGDFIDRFFQVSGFLEKVEMKKIKGMLENLLTAKSNLKSKTTLKFKKIEDVLKNLLKITIK